MEENEEIENLLAEIEAKQSELESLENGENEDEYENMIDECNAEVIIGSLRYCPSHVLKEVDPIAFNCGLSEFNDERISELNEEIKELQQEVAELRKGGEENVN